MRIVVVGSPGAGKSTLARRLAARHGAPYVELDALHWAPGWTEVSDAVMRERVTAATTGPAWVVDGNYPAVRDLLWPRATLVVWLDLPLVVVVARLVRRTVGRVITREELWHGNRESLALSFFSRESVIWWALKTFERRRAVYTRLAADPASPPVVRLRSAGEVERWFTAGAVTPRADRDTAG